MKKAGVIAAIIFVAIYLMHSYIKIDDIQKFFVSQKSFNDMALKNEKVPQIDEKEKPKSKVIDAEDVELGLRCSSGRLNYSMTTFPANAPNQFYVFLEPHKSTFWFKFISRGSIDIFVYPGIGYFESENHLLRLNSVASGFNLDLGGRGRVVAGDRLIQGVIFIYPGVAVGWGEKATVTTNKIKENECNTTKINLPASSLVKVPNMKLKKGQCLFILSQNQEKRIEDVRFSAYLEKEDWNKAAQFFIYSWNPKTAKIDKVILRDTFPVVWEITRPGDIYLGGLEKELDFSLIPINQEPN